MILAADSARRRISALVELAELLRTGIMVSAFARQARVWRFLDRHAMTFKKNSARRRAGAARRRRAGARPGSSASLSSIPQRLVFIDETGASTKMARLRGRAQRGQRCRVSRPARALEDHDLHRRRCRSAA